MSNYKRCAPTIAAMEEDSSSTAPTISKKRKTTAHQNLQSSNSSLGNFPDITVSPENSLNFPGTVVSGEFHSDRSPVLSCCSSNSAVRTGEFVKELNTTPLDPQPQTKGFETVDSSCYNFKSFSLLSEFSGDSEETTTFAAKSSVAAKMPPKEEIEEFFAIAEKYEQKRFAEKYNFDIVTDMPLEGRYQWVRLHWICHEWKIMSERERERILVFIERELKYEGIGTTTEFVARV